MWCCRCLVDTKPLNLDVRAVKLLANLAELVVRDLEAEILTSRVRQND